MTAAESGDRDIERKYIGYAAVDAEDLEVSFESKFYNWGGPMIRDREGGSLCLWMANSHWSEWRDWAKVDCRDVELCHAFLTGALPDDEARREDDAYLLERGYLIRKKTGNGYAFNAVWLDSPDVETRLNAAIPDLGDAYGPAVEALYGELLELYAWNQPEVLRPQIMRTVKGMLPHNTIGAHMLKKLRVYRGATHPHEAQRPEPLSI